jgi:DMSO reductase family type II enzyme chaperone
MSVHTGPNPRADLYGLFAELLSFPGSDLARAVGSGEVRGAVEHMLAHLPAEIPAPAAVLGPMDLDPRDLESEFIRLFDVPDGPATPLYTGVYAPRRRDAMEELLRIYRHFGLTIEGTAHDLPDFVPTVLEFLQFLTLGQSSASPESRAPFESAKADILERHLCPWAAQTASRLADRSAQPFYQGVVEILKHVAGGELADLRRGGVAAAAGGP